MKEPFIQKAITLSTGHISQNDNEYLKRAARFESESEICVDATPYGYIVYVNQGSTYHNEPAALKAILTYAVENGIDFVLLDRDESEVDIFPTFDW